MNPRRITEEECLWALDDAYLEYGRRPTRNEYDRFYSWSILARSKTDWPPHHRTIRRRFGSWAAACETTDIVRVETLSGTFDRAGGTSMLRSGPTLVQVDFNAVVD